mmetsp:Transcript_20005/g.46860  ORF Transcript_20005/g.46860 Transcript_20005/m.46860 type:complete len:562 (+) Transcript_20005:46-1731(+)
MAGDDGEAEGAAKQEDQKEGDEAADVNDEQVDVYEGYTDFVTANSLGVFDGKTFYLRSFPVWYRWTPWQYQQNYNNFTANKPETGVVDGVYFEQTMGRIVLYFELMGPDAELTEDDLVVEISSWEIRVTVGNDVPKGKSGAQKISPLCNELMRDIRRKHSFWYITEDAEEYPGRWLVFNLAKLEHRPWRGPWYDFCLNPHKKQSFGWTPLHISYQLMKLLKSEEETLARVQPGAPEEPEKGLCTGILPSKICTGIEDDQDESETEISVIVHFDEETLELATGMVPMEELFAADVSAGAMEIYLRSDEFALCSGSLLGLVIPELTTWEIKTVRRKKLPKDIKAPAYYNPALRVTLVKAPGHQQRWGHAFSELRTPDFEPAKERINWTDRVQRALVLSPAAPMSVTTKTERAVKMCTRIDYSQDQLKAFLILHMEDKLEEMSYRYKVDLTTFFSLKVGEKMLQVNVVADAEYKICCGALGGKCVPEKTTWEMTKEKNSPEEDREHIAVKVGLLKAPDSRETWEEIYTSWDPWEVTSDMHQSLLKNPPDGMKVKGAPGEATETE